MKVFLTSAAVCAALLSASPTWAAEKNKSVADLLQSLLPQAEQKFCSIPPNVPQRAPAPVCPAEETAPTCLCS